MHWIEEAEQIKTKREKKRDNIHSRIDQKKGDVKKNWDKNSEAYLAFQGVLKDYIERINSLPRETRMEFGRIESKEKKSSLPNHLIKYSSSRRKIIRKFDGLLNPFKAKHYKNTRNIFLSLSREIDYVLIEVKEIHAPRIRLNEETDSSILSFLRRFKPKEHSIVERGKAHLKINDLTSDFAIYCIDFLAFKNDGKSYFFTNNAKKESKEA